MLLKGLHDVGLVEEGLDVDFFRFTVDEIVQHLQQEIGETHHGAATVPAADIFLGRIGTLEDFPDGPISGMLFLIVDPVQKVIVEDFLRRV